MIYLKATTAYSLYICALNSLPPQVEQEPGIFAAVKGISTVSIDPGVALWLSSGVQKQLLKFSNLHLEFSFDFPITYPSHWSPRPTTIPKAGPELIPKLSQF
jgi:hypothetical protein